MLNYRLTSTGRTTLARISKRVLGALTGRVALQVHLSHDTGQALVVETRIVRICPLGATFIAGAVVMTFCKRNGYKY